MHEFRRPDVETPVLIAKGSNPLHQAVLHEQAGRISSAEKAYRKAVLADPKNQDGHRRLSEFYQRRGKLKQAEASLVRGITQTGQAAGLRVDLGTFYQRIGQPANAEAAYRAVLADDPDHPAALTNLAGLCFVTGAYDKGLEVANKACQVAPDHPAPHSNRGNLLAALGQIDSADSAFKTALTLDPNHADALANWANHLKNSGRIAAAVETYRDGVQRFRNDPRFAFGLSLSALGTGDLATGWGYYEAGFSTGDRVPDRRRAAPDWFGNDLSGKTLLIWPEQGLGDELLFASCLGDLRRALPQTRIILECDPRLVRIYRRSFPKIEVCPEDGTIVGSIEAQAPIGRLPGLFRTTIESFSASKAFLSAEDDLRDQMRKRLDSLPPGKKIGINWRSGLITQQREHGLTELDDWQSLLTAPGIVPVTLQYGDVEAELQALETSHGVTIHRWPDLDLRDDLDRVFALISELDAVVNVGTSVMGMAGALGIPQHILLREQEWITLGTGRMPWFENTIIHERKLAEGWSAAIDSVKTALIP